MFINAMHSMVLAAAVHTVILDTEKQQMVEAMGREIDMDVLQSVAIARVREAVDTIMHHTQDMLDPMDRMATCGMTGWMDGFLIGARWARLSTGVPR